MEVFLKVSITSDLLYQPKPIFSHCLLQSGYYRNKYSLTKKSVVTNKKLVTYSLLVKLHPDKFHSLLIHFIHMPK